MTSSNYSAKGLRDRIRKLEESLDTAVRAYNDAQTSRQKLANELRSLQQQLASEQTASRLLLDQSAQTDPSGENLTVGTTGKRILRIMYVPAAESTSSQKHHRVIPSDIYMKCELADIPLFNSRQDGDQYDLWLPLQSSILLDVHQGLPSCNVIFCDNVFWKQAVSFQQGSLIRGLIEDRRIDVIIEDIPLQVGEKPTFRVSCSAHFLSNKEHFSIITGDNSNQLSQEIRRWYHDLEPHSRIPSQKRKAVASDQASGPRARIRRKRARTTM